MNRAALRILCGLALGLVGGSIMAGRAGATPILAVTASIGRLWLDALTMTVVPLVFSLLVTGILGAAEDARQSRVALRAMLWFAALLAGGCLAAAMSTTLLLQLWPVGDAAASLRPEGAVPAFGGAADWISGIIPTNPIKAAAETAMVPLVVFALFFGFAAARIPAELQRALQLLFRAIAETMLVVVHWVLIVAPLGVFALAFGLGVRAGADSVGVLVHYIVTVASACLLILILAYAAVFVFGRLSPLRFAKAALPAQIVALSTQSSLATLPAMIEAAPGLSVGRASAGIILPLAVSIFRGASAAANIAVALYLAALYGQVPSPGMLVIGALAAAAVSLAAVGLPAQVSFFATIGPVCLALGVPVELLPLLLAVETIPDLFRTVGNVTADMAVLRLAGREKPALAAGGESG
ncbi:dicarboxylate/amino acid:cation symporter [Sphingomonas xinjiangensis]|uniref:Na+/H+-dicarboxylate symporter n=1 Tax=Sphingomonas xinjiangensis TaxID=643568 RepID=A0A840YCB2_9SPHN|nr:cation:dicarboxylase symporter family transporter [Sphingomonas xinjiangensis]MBB5711007.1 Na+/H+-dicarboxylate symporter [Sphingomonas xinjiangensis]